MTVTLDGSPIEGVTVTGITTEDGSPCVTNSEGKTSGVTGVDTVTIKTSSGFVDVNEASQVVNTGGALETNASLTITSKSSGSIQVTASQNIRFNPNRASVTYFIVGGGAGGTAARYVTTGSVYYMISGAGGGYTDTGTINPQGDVAVTIGSGGSGGSTTTTSSQGYSNGGSRGGETTISGLFGTKTASGGSPGDFGLCNFNRTDTYFGGAGGSGGGGASNIYGDTSVQYAGNGGSNGSNGYSNGANLQTPTGQSSGGAGQGTTTTFGGVTYSPGGSGMVYSTGMGTNVQGTPASGAGTNLVTASSGTAGSATIPGGAGGWCYCLSIGSFTLKGGSGANGIAIFSW